MSEVEITRENLDRSIKRARELKPKVTIDSLDERRFVVKSVSTPGNVYLVEFEVAEEAGQRVIGGRCHRVDPETLEKLSECPGAKFAGHCYHLAAAAGVNIGIRQARSGKARWAA